MVVQIIAAIGLLGYLIALVLYVAEAWQLSSLQAILCAVVPFYLIYFAFIKSQRELPYRLVLSTSVILMFVLPAALYLIEQFGVSNG